MLITLSCLYLIFVYFCDMEKLQDRARHIFMMCFETTNSQNCYGYCPQKNNTIPYIKAKKYMVKLCKKHNDFELLQYTIKNL